MYVSEGKGGSSIMFRTLAKRLSPADTSKVHWYSLSVVLLSQSNSRAPRSEYVTRVYRVFPLTV